MRRYAFCLILPMFLGCAGKNVVSGEDKTKAEQLAADLPSWCETTCKRLQECSVQDQECDCNGDVCNCTGVSASCAEDCEDSLSDFAKSTEECADVGRSYQACIDTLSCADLGNEPNCLPDRAQLEGCSLDDSSDGPPSSGTGGASGVGGTVGDDSGYAGSFAYGGATSEAGTSSGGASSSGGAAPAGGASSSGGTGVAGTGTGGGPAGPVVSCQGSTGSGAAGSANQGGGAYVTCEETLGGCTDGHEYSWICVDDAAGHNWCSCFFDGNPVGALAPALVCPVTAEVNAACGWNLQ